MSEHNGEPQRLVTLEGVGRFVWEPGLSLVDFIPKGRRAATRTITLRPRQNTRRGALRVIARMLQEEAT